MRPGKTKLVAFLVLVLAGCLLTAPAADARGPRVKFAKRVLTVTGGDKDNSISVFCGLDGNVKMNGRNPAGGAVGCGRVAEVDVVPAAATGLAQALEERGWRLHG